LQQPKTTRTLSIQSVVTKPHNAAENPKTNNARTKASFSHGKKKSWGSDGFSFFLSHFRLCNQKEEDTQEMKKI
jgi:hypothetical protein